MDAASASRASPARVPVTLRMVLAIAVPMTIAHATTPLIGITDMAVIGQLGSAALIGGVALGALLFDFIGGSLNFLRMGTTGLVAQAMGAEDREGEATALWRALALAAALGCLIVLLQRPIFHLFALAMNPSEAVAAATDAYWGIRVWASPFMLANYAILGWLLGLARARTGLVLQILLSLVNIAGSLLLVLVFDLGITGVAVASVVAAGSRSEPDSGFDVTTGAGAPMAGAATGAGSGVGAGAAAGAFPPAWAWSGRFEGSSHSPQKRHLTAASWIISAQYGQAFTARRR